MKETQARHKISSLIHIAQVPIYRAIKILELKKYNIELLIIKLNSDLTKYFAAFLFVWLDFWNCMLYIHITSL